MRRTPPTPAGCSSAAGPGPRPVKYRDAAGIPRCRATARRPVARGRAARADDLHQPAVLGPLARAWLWVGSQVDYCTGSTFAGHHGRVLRAAAHAAPRAGHLAAHRPALDPRPAGRRLRPARGHDRRACSPPPRSSGPSLFFVWFILIKGPGSSLGPAPSARWACSTTTSSSRACRTRRSARGCASEADERRRKALATRRAARPLADDLARAAPPRRRHRDHLRRPPRPATARATRTALELRRELGRPPRPRARPRRRRQRRGRSCCASPRAALHGAGRRARHPVALLPALPADGPGARAGGPSRSRRWTSTSCSRAVSERTRVIALCNPNDPTGAYLPADELRRLLERAARARRRVLLDEALRRLRRRGAGPAARWPCSTTSPACSCSAPSRRPTAWPACAAATRWAARLEPLLEQIAPALGVSRPRAGRRAGGAAQMRAAGRARGAQTVLIERHRLLESLGSMAGRRPTLARPTSCGCARPACPTASWRRACAARPSSCTRAPSTASPTTSARRSSPPQRHRTACSAPLRGRDLRPPA